MANLFCDTCPHMIINLYQKLATKQTQFRKYQTHGNVSYLSQGFCRLFHVNGYLRKTVLCSKEEKSLSLLFLSSTKTKTAHAYL